jgi:hypothetical protein
MRFYALNQDEPQSSLHNGSLTKCLRNIVRSSRKFPLKSQLLRNCINRLQVTFCTVASV